MSERNDLRQAAAKVLDRDEVDGVLSSTFYAPSSGERPVPYQARAASQDKPLHYKVI